MACKGVVTTGIVLLCCLLVVADAINVPQAAGRKLLQAGERPSHDYAQQLSISASQAAIQRLSATPQGLSASALKEATELSLKNAQITTKYRGQSKASLYKDGVEGPKVEGGDDDDK